MSHEINDAAWDSYSYSMIKRTVAECFKCCRISRRTQKRTHCTESTKKIQIARNNPSGMILCKCKRATHSAVFHPIRCGIIYCTAAHGLPCISASVASFCPNLITSMMQRRAEWHSGLHCTPFGVVIYYSHSLWLIPVWPFPG